MSLGLLLSHEWAHGPPKSCSWKSMRLSTQRSGRAQLREGREYNCRRWFSDSRSMSPARQG